MLGNVMSSRPLQGLDKGLQTHGWQLHYWRVWGYPYEPHTDVSLFTNAEAILQGMYNSHSVVTLFMVWVLNKQSGKEPVTACRKDTLMVFILSSFNWGEIKLLLSI